MNYTEALEYIHSINWTFCKPGLERISELCQKLGNPQNDLKFVHVAGTNGKGSFCAMLESILREAGYKTGFFTSPYIKVFNERMQISGEMISEDELAEITEYVKPFADEMTDKPTEFELITAIAFVYFKRHNCDIVILEAGMGGRLDSTNVIETPVLSVITGIALDHTQFLGNTVEEIAKEKAGIIKNNIPVLYGGEDTSAEKVIKEYAKNNGFYTVDYSLLKIRQMTLKGTVFDFKDRKHLYISLLGKYQPKNASSVLCAVDILKKCGFNICENSVLRGLSSAKWIGRFEILNENPLVIFDGAHNPQGICASVESVLSYFDKKVYILTGVLKDKDYLFIAKELSKIAEKAFTITPDNPRALSSEEYAEILENEGIISMSFKTINEAYKKAKEEAKRDNKPLIILGSLYTYASLFTPTLHFKY